VAAPLEDRPALQEHPPQFVWYNDDMLLEVGQRPSSYGRTIT
jgi:hypothetical protein